MNKIVRWSIIAAITGCGCLFALTSFSRDCMTVSGDVFDKNARPYVCFEHDDHNDAAGIDDCSVCHHVYEDGQLVEGESSEDSYCSDCHYEQGDSRQLDLVARYHKRCRGCHLEMKTGPILCGECHKKGVE